MGIQVYRRQKNYCTAFSDGLEITTLEWVPWALGIIRFLEKAYSGGLERIRPEGFQNGQN
jgi:hypothetical protein